jgi:hypothetical protein
MTSRGLYRPALSPRLAAAALLFSLLPAHLPAAGQRPVPVPAGTPRFSLVAERTAVGVGRALNVKLQLQDANGGSISAPATLDIVLTITRLQSLQSAREAAAKIQPATPPTAATSLQGRGFVLRAGESVVRTPAVFARGQGDVDFTVTSQAAGEVSIYVEAVGSSRVQPGSALVVVTEQLRRMRREEAEAIQRIAWRPQRTVGAHLKFRDSGLDVTLEGKNFVRPFSVGLQDEQGRWILPPGGTPLRIQLAVTQGSANFDPPLVTIDPEDPISRDQTKLRSSVGGTVELAAQTVDRDIADARERFTYELGARATRLDVQPVSTSALANGLDAITVDVSAIYAEGTQPGRVMTAAQEGLLDRRVLITFTGGSASQKTAELVIPKDATSQTIQVVSSRHARHLAVHAKSINGYQQVITGTADVQFNLPWAQLAGAIAGGLLVPLIFRGTTIRILIGGVGGGLLYILVFFGAVLTGEHSLGSVAVALTQLPTENVFAAFALGVLGYVIVSPALPKPPAARARKEPARVGQD